MAKKSRSSATKATAALVLLGIAVAACGGAQPPAANSPADESSPAAAGSSPQAAPAMDQKGQAQPPAPAPEMSSTQAAPPSGGSSASSSDGVQAALRDARHDVDTARRDLEASYGDCVNVCRALSSLERVTAHFCALASNDSDRGACEDAKTRVYKARARIKESCGTCANGAPLDANAPLNTR